MRLGGAEEGSGKADSTKAKKEGKCLHVDFVSKSLQNKRMRRELSILDCSCNQAEVTN